MAQPYPEGEVFFKRDVFPFLTDENAFYSNFLIEHVWNDYPELDEPAHLSDFMKYENFGSRAPAEKRHWDAWWDSFWDFAQVTVMHSENREGRPAGAVKSGFAFKTNLSWDEYKDLVYGGPYKVRFQPMPIGDQPYILIDLSVNIRALYFPAAYQADEAYPDHCTYLMIDFTNHNGQSAIRYLPTPDSPQNVTIECDHGRGLLLKQPNFTVHGLTLGINIKSLYLYLSLPRHLRNPARGVFKADEYEKEIIWFLKSDEVKFGRDQITDSIPFSKEIDYAKVLSANTGLQLTWAPLIPIAGPFLEVGFTIAVTAVTDPDKFAGDNILDLGRDIIDAIIDSAADAKEFMVPDVNITFNTPAEKTVAPERRIRLLHDRDKKNGGLRPSLYFILRKPGRPSTPRQSRDAATGRGKETYVDS